MVLRLMMCGFRRHRLRLAPVRDGKEDRATALKHIRSRLKVVERREPAANSVACDGLVDFVQAHEPRFVVDCAPVPRLDKSEQVA